MVASAAIFKRCNEIVGPALLAQRQPGDEVATLVVLATVKGDLHDLGKNIVGAMLRTSGFEVLDLGKDVSADTLVATIKEKAPAILGLSVLLTTTVPYQETVLKRLVTEGIRDQVKVMVGGAPVTPEWADKIGADGYANNAPEAVEIARAARPLGRAVPVRVVLHRDRHAHRLAGVRHARVGGRRSRRRADGSLLRLAVPRRRGTREREHRRCPGRGRDPDDAVGHDARRD